MDAVDVSALSARDARRRGSIAREHVVVTNHGWFFFGCVPFVCGNARTNAVMPIAFFRDDIAADVIHDRLTGYAAQKGYLAEDISFNFNDSVIFEIPGTSIPIPMPYVLCFRDCSVAAVLTEPAAHAVPVADAKSPKAQAAAAAKRRMQRLLENIPDGGVR